MKKKVTAVVLIILMVVTFLGIYLKKSPVEKISSLIASEKIQDAVQYYNEHVDKLKEKDVVEIDKLFSAKIAITSCTLLLHTTPVV